MSRWILVAGSVLFASCTSVHKNSEPNTTAAPQASMPTKPEAPSVQEASAPLPEPQPTLPLSYRRQFSQGVELFMVCFDDRQYGLLVADQAGGPGSLWNSAVEAANAHGGLAAINGGFFTPAGKPLGLLVSSGLKKGHANPSSLGTGMFVSSAAGSAIIRREQYSSSALASGADNLLQAGPMLVESGQNVSGLSANKHRPRSFIAWDGGHHWAIGHARSCTLASLAEALKKLSLTGFKVTIALNLDGGRSADLWVGPQISEHTPTHRSFFNEPARNYLILTKR